MSNKLQASFTVDPKVVNSNLIAIARIGGRFSKAKIIQIRICTDAIEIITQGITKRMKANTDGEADIYLPVSLLKTYLSSSSSGLVSFTFRQGELECGSSRYSSAAIEVTPVSLRPENILPINLNRISILRYGVNNSEAEIQKMGLTGTLKVATRKMKTNILEALEFLKEYEVKYEELEELVKKKIKN